jgi:hypothetical protein
MSAPTCAPPPEHAHHDYHWLRQGENKPVPVDWAVGSWWNLPGRCDDPVDPDEAAAEGWRYIGPAIPPTEGEGG